MTNQYIDTFYKMMQNPQPKLMGILNITPDSFSGDGVLKKGDFIAAAISQAELFIKQGADIIDIGGESTRPGATPVSLEEELKRVIPVICAIRSRFSIPLSIDTTKAEVAAQAIKAGITIINDVSGLLMDPYMIELTIQHQIPIIIMHSQQAKRVSQCDNPHSLDTEKNIVERIKYELEHLSIHAIGKGVKPSQIILDPGIGFGKSAIENLTLVANLDQLKSLGYPVLLGVSRKSFIGHITEAAVENRLPGSLAAATVGILRGADIIRAHDVPETKQVIDLLTKIETTTFYKKTNDYFPL